MLEQVIAKSCSVVELGILGRKEEGDRTALQGLTDGIQSLRIGVELLEVSFSELGPELRLVVVAAAKLITGRRLFQLGIQPGPLLADPPGPQAVHEEPYAVR